jgi:hypothetical protein
MNEQRLREGVSKRRWLGKTRCDFCGEDVRKHKEFFDAKTLLGPWALMCDKCFLMNGEGRIGLGWGQKYDGDTLEKIGG